MAEQERLTHIALAQPVVRGDIASSMGSHIQCDISARYFSEIFQRDMPECAAEPVHESAEAGHSGAQ